MTPARAEDVLALDTRLPSLDHLLALTDDTGTIQHATYDVPNRSTGYCTDDVARALIVAIRAGRVAPHLRPAALRLARTSLAFLAHAQCRDGRFHNFMSFERTWLDEVGGDDANGRAIWALGVAVRSAPTFGFRALASEIVSRALKTIDTLEPAHLRPRAFAALGLVELLRAERERPAPSDARVAELRERLAAIGDALLAAYRAHASADWVWFEETMTYDNARLCEALLRTGDALSSPEYIEAGARALAFYERTTLADGVFVPIGNAGWYGRGGARATEGQQPLEAAALVDAALAGWLACRSDPAAGLAPAAHYEALARAGLAWFHGANSIGLSLVTPSGGCADGIETTSANENAGAESTLAYLAAAYAIAAHAPAR